MRNELTFNLIRGNTTFGIQKLFLVLTIICIPLTLITIVPADWAGWLMFGVTFAILATQAPNMGNQIWWLYVVLIFHQLVSIINAYYVILPTASADAEDFHRLAIEIALTHHFTFAINGIFYKNFLAVFYLICKSRFFGQELSVFAFTCSLIVLRRLLKYINVSKDALIIMLVYGLYPTTLLWTSIIMREAWIILFFMSCIYFVCRIYVEGVRFWYLSGMLFTCLMMVFFHVGLTVVMPFLLLTFVFGYMFFSNHCRNFLISMWPTVTSVAFVLCILYWSEVYNMVHAINVKILFYRHGIFSTGGNTRYYVPLNIDSRAAYSSFATLPNYLFYYLMMPLPWQIKDVTTMLLAFNAFFKLVLLCSSAYFCFQAKRPFKYIYILLLVIYCETSIVWSMATTNHGTAIRHQITNDWIIYILGIPTLLELLRKLTNKVIQGFHMKRCY